ncbi:IS5 family transposase [Saccharibacillus brassicae]|uniref:IS5 family transposase n=1 Tax=Saccharibacillus brassicae TaxID=2583377 RepID=A0A4Y6V1Z4_SACBS|nr:IS5 family transposase [Saccharibacillus brassicae]QDH22641.1 IS5 family transposase [Saccharibacillus brassicae]
MQGIDCKQAIGRLRGGLTTKIQAIFDALDNPLQFELIPGQAYDSVKGYERISTLELEDHEVPADRAYDTDAIRELLRNQNAIAVIPSKKNRRVKSAYDRNVYKERHLVECFFNKVKNYRRLATRYNKTASMFKAFLALISIRIWLK